jgi:hypothetical protein
LAEVDRTDMIYLQLVIPGAGLFAREPGIHNHGRWSWIPARDAIAAGPE